MPRAKKLVGTISYNKKTFNFSTRRRPQYADIGHSKVFDVKAYEAKDDGTTSDIIILNSFLAVAANMSSIVHIPCGIYKVTDTLRIPKESRIVGQAWSHLMATGTKFQDVGHPHDMVIDGNKSNIGIIEIQDLVFTVSGDTAGAVLVEWNIHESSQSSAALRDSHFRVGGTKGSNLQASECLKSQFLHVNVNQKCIADSLLLHITSSSSVDLEKVWTWTAEHDLDVPPQYQIDVFFSARGILIESRGPTWSHGTAFEHNTPAIIRSTGLI